MTGRPPYGDVNPGASAPGSVSSAEFGALVGSLIAQNLLLASKLDCLVDLLVHQGIITPELLDLYADASVEEARKRYDLQLEEIGNGDEDSSDT
jgi:hypothetical protein